MRLRRLDLARYGKFTDRSIDFGEKPSAAPDLHLVYGPNEAGKSTTIAAYLDLLYGIETRSAYGFLHDYPTMLVGACLEIDGTSRELRRIKRPQGSLRDAHDAVLPEAVVQGPLGGIDRAAYGTMFSLDDDTLEKGGNAILASKGELGQLLFSASAGLADMSAALETFQKKTDGFYRFRAQNTELSELKRELKALDEERERLDTAASRYSILLKERDAARNAYDDARLTRDALQRDLARDRRVLAAMPHWLACRKLAGDLAGLGELIAVPDGWDRLLPVLQEEEPRLAVEKATLETRLKTIEEDMAALLTDKELVALAPRIADADMGRTRFVTAGLDLPARRERVKASDAAMAALLARLGSPDRDPADLALTGVVEGGLRRLMESHSGLVATRATAEKEHAIETGRLAELHAELPARGDASPADDPCWDVLAQALSETEASDHEARLRIAEREGQDRAALLLTLRAALAPWTGEWQDLAAMPIPDAAELEGLRRAAEEAQRAVREASANRERVVGELARLRARIEAAGRAEGLLTDADIAALRTERERAWAAHRATLDPATAETFEAVMRRDDGARDSLVAHADRIGGLRQLVADEALAVVSLTEATAARDQAEASVVDQRERLTSCLDELSLPPTVTADALLAFGGHRRQALEAWDAARRQDGLAAQARADEARLLRHLAEALSLCGPSPKEGLSLATLQRQAKAVLESRTAAREAARRLAEQNRIVARRADELENAVAAERAWQAAWEAQCAECWLGADEGAPDPAAMAGLLADLAQLQNAVRERKEFAYRVETMEDDCRTFLAQAAALCAEAGQAIAEDDVLAAFDALEQRVTAAVEKAGRWKTRQTELSAAREKRSELEARLVRHHQSRQVILDHFGVDTLSAAASALNDAVARQRQAHALADRQSDLFGTLGVMTMAEAESLLATIDRDALEASVSAAEHALVDANAACEERSARLRTASAAVEAVGADAAVARIEEQRQTVLATIRDGAERWLRLRLATAAAEKALAIYRERHRGSMLAKASEAFCTISRGAYRSLTTQPAADGSETLLAVDSDGRSKLAPALSKGTRFQLYLALRVAGYHEFAKVRTPVPFVADDIMETFDDFRAEETFRLFTGMAEAGQVIYFTHHRHLVDIARQVCPDVRVHQL